MGKLFIDITELKTWQGRLTGVPRVMNELASRFAAGEAQLVSWDSGDHAYHKVQLSKGSEKKVTFTNKVTRKLLGLGSMSVSIKGGDTLFVLADWHGSDPEFVNYLIAYKRSGIKLIQVCYDLLPIVTPQFSGHATESLIRYSKAVYPLCDVILAISENTKHDVAKWLKQNKLKVPEIRVMRLGDDFTFAKAIRPREAFFKTGNDFILCVGTIEIRKNHKLLYDVYKLAAQKGKTLPNLVIVGRVGWKAEDVYETMTTDPQTKDKFIILESASDEELSWLYGHCLFSIYPSFYEGWGLPVAESAARRVPCLASNTSSIPEIAGDLIEYFNPSSSSDCLKAITNLLQPSALKAANQKLRNYQPASWDDTFTFIKKAVEQVNG